MKPANTFPSVGLLRNPRIEAVNPITIVAQTNSSPLRRWMVPPFFTDRATAPRTMASPPAAMWIGKSMLALTIASHGRHRPAPSRAPTPLDEHQRCVQPHGQDEHHRKSREPSREHPVDDVVRQVKRREEDREQGR